MSHAVRLPCDEAAIRSGPRAAAATPAVGRWVLAATILGSSMAFIDGTVVSVALPAIAREFPAAGADLQWVAEAYALFPSALLLPGGSPADRFGRPRVPPQRAARGHRAADPAARAREPESPGPWNRSPRGFSRHRRPRGPRIRSDRIVAPGLGRSSNPRRPDRGGSRPRRIHRRGRALEMPHADAHALP